MSLPSPTEGPSGTDPPPRRRYPSTVGGALYLVVLTGTVLGLLIAADGSWRTGVRWIGGSLLFAAASRLALSNPSAGMLAVRHKITDALVLTLLGVALLVLATSIPDQPA